MGNPFCLTDKQMACIEPFFPQNHCKQRFDDRSVQGGIIFNNRRGLRWCDAPKEYSPSKTFHNRWKRWSDKAGFAQIMDG
jgi:transposase